MKLRTILAWGLGWLMGLCALPLAAAPDSGKIAGVVVDPTGAPQMGATVLVSPEELLQISPIESLTNGHGRFSTAKLAPGTYSVKVTLAGFLPAVEQHIQVSGKHTTVLEVVLGSVFSSLEEMRRQPNQQMPADDWSWVLRSSAANRSVLQWQAGRVLVLGQMAQEEPPPPSRESRGRVVLSSGADHPGSIADAADSPATTFVYDLGVGSGSQLFMAGQFSYGNGASTGGFATQWLPSGKEGTGPVTTLVVRESQVGPAGAPFRGLRLSHDDQLVLSDRVKIQYGGELLVAELGRTTTALRPRAEVDVQLARRWKASAIVSTQPWQNDTETPTGLESTMDALDAYPTVLLDHNRPVTENDLHDELAVEYALSKNAQVVAAFFHDSSTDTAVIGRGGAANGPDFLQDYFSQAFAYDGGRSSSSGMRVAYKQRLTDWLTTAVVYAYAGALGPNQQSPAAALGDQLATQDRHSVATSVASTLPHLGTKITTAYKWLNGPAVSQQDPYGESIYHIAPYLSMQVRQPLPGFFSGHMEVEADAGNLLAQGYVPIATSQGRVVLVPAYRYFRGGLSLQF
ncbi:MAG: carboxypeptidase-like regulatory domain-containing protein [Candidatus Acidiferrales bacterium]